MTKSKDPAAVSLGRRGGLARALALSPARRLEIARIASAAARVKRLALSQWIDDEAAHPWAEEAAQLVGERLGRLDDD